MIQSINSQNLVRLAREGGAGEYASALRETGSAVLSNAVEVFCAMDRETENGRTAVDQLKDLKNSLIAHIERVKSSTTSHLDSALATCEQATKGQHPTHKLQPAKTEILSNAMAMTANKEVQSLKRETSAEATKIQLPQVDEMTGVKKFLADLTAVQGLYTASVMIPGPLSATVKNVAKELYTSNMQANSSASGSSHAAGGALSLLGVGGFASDSGFSSQSSASGNARYEKSTIDERIVPVLSELQDRLSQASVVPATKGEIEARQAIHEYQGRSTWCGLGDTVYDKNLGSLSSYYRRSTPDVIHGSDTNGDGRVKRSLETFEYQPEHIRLPETSISDYSGKG